MNNGANGHTPPQIVAAQRELERASVPLAKLNEEIADAQRKLKVAETALEAAQRADDMASTAYARNDTPSNYQRLRDADAAAKAAATKVRVLRQDLGELEAKRPPLQAEVDTKAAALSKLGREVRKQQIEDEIASSKFKLAQHQQACMEWQHKINTLADERLAMVREEMAERDLGMRAAHAKFLRDNGPTPGFERTVRSFGA